MTYLPQIISPKILQTKLWNFVKIFLTILAAHSKNFSFWIFVEKNIIVKIPRWHVWSSETLESKALIPNIMKPAPKIEKKRDQRLRNSHFEGETSNTLHKWTILRWYEWPKPASIYRSPWGPNIVLANNNNNVRAQ